MFLVLALKSDDGRRRAGRSLLFAFIAWTDYLDGMAARITGQYSRLGALLDPLTDRLLVLAGAIVCWHFELLPRWALLVLAAREVLMLVLTQIAFEARDGPQGQHARPLGGVAGDGRARRCAGRRTAWVAESLLYVGLAMTLAATALYLQDGLRALREDPQARLERTLYSPSASSRKDSPMDTFPDLGALSDQELKDLIQQLTEEEQEVSYQRRILHGKIDILRAELVNRLRKKHEEGESVITGADVQQLTDILVRQGHSRRTEPT